MEGLFELKRPSDLFNKLKWEYEQLSQHPTDSRIAYNFVVTAYHLLEWLIPDREADFRMRRKTLKQLCPALDICYHLAIGAKHFAPSNPNLNSVRSTGRASWWPKGYWAEGYWAKGYWPDSLAIELSGEARDAYGEAISVLQLGEFVMEFWSGHFDKNT